MKTRRGGMFGRKNKNKTYRDNLKDHGRYWSREPFNPTTYYPGSTTFQQPTLDYFSPNTEVGRQYFESSGQYVDGIEPEPDLSHYSISGPKNEELLQDLGTVRRDTRNRRRGLRPVKPLQGIEEDPNWSGVDVGGRRRRRTRRLKRKQRSLSFTCTY